MTRDLKVACAGAGYFSQFHYQSWKRMDRLELVGSCNRDISKARAMGVPAYDNLEKMLAETNPDILDIILPPVAHASYIRTAISAGIKTVICQKPFCENLAEARQITAEAEAAGMQIVIHENFRFQPWYRRIKSEIDANRIGAVQQMTFRLRPGDGQGPKAYLDRQPYFQDMPKFLVHETAVHFVDTFRYLLGDPASVYADLRKVNPVIAGEDAGYILFEFPTGARALFDGNRTLDHAADNRRRTMGEALVEGDAGCIVLTGDGALTLRGFGDNEVQEILAPSTWEGFGGDCVHALQSHVVSGLLDGSEIENRASDYLRVIEIEGAIYESAQSGCKVTLEES